MSDRYPTADGLTAQARSLRAVTPNNDTDLSICKALYVGGAGDISILAADDASPVTLAAVPGGTILPVRARRVRATGTTATNIVALY